MRRMLSILCTVAPFVAAAIAALGARHDLRMLWMAIVVTLVAQVVHAVTPGRRTFSAGISLVLGTIIASAVALLAGARAPFGIIAVALVLAIFATAGVWLRARALRPRS